jgi:hypothetical protein
VQKDLSDLASLTSRYLQVTVGPMMVTVRSLSLDGARGMLSRLDGTLVLHDESCQPTLMQVVSNIDDCGCLHDRRTMTS